MILPSAMTYARQWKPVRTKELLFYDFAFVTDPDSGWSLVCRTVTLNIAGKEVHTTIVDMPPSTALNLYYSSQASSVLATGNPCFKLE